VKIESIRDVQRWLASKSAAVQRIKEAAALTKRDEVRVHLKEWQVTQREGMIFPVMLQEFHDKVSKAAQKLQLELSDSAAQPPSISDSAQQPASSTAQQSAPMDAAANVGLDQNPARAHPKAQQRKRA